jgi:4-carboxymuconolactone decarboxylase
MTDVRETGTQVFRELLPNLLPKGQADLPRGGFADGLLEIGVDNVFGRLWGRDVICHSSGYAGFPAAATANRIAGEALTD